MQCDGSDFVRSYETMQAAFEYVRNERKPILVHARVPLLGHHTSGVRKEFYRTREDLLKHGLYDPIPKLRLFLTGMGFNEHEINEVESAASKAVAEAFELAQLAQEPTENLAIEHVFAPTTIKEKLEIEHLKEQRKVLWLMLPCMLLKKLCKIILKQFYMVRT
jgi:2-oxoisovalerate dehydrogenase E1 component